MGITGTSGKAAPTDATWAGGRYPPQVQPEQTSQPKREEKGEEKKWH